MGRLTSTGSSNALKRKLFPAGFAGEVMALILDVWKQFSRRRQLQLEQRITAVFKMHWQQPMKRPAEDGLSIGGPHY